MHHSTPLPLEAPLGDLTGGPEIELLRMADVLQRVPFSRTTLWRRVRAGEFPSPVRLGGPNSRIIAWRATDVTAWQRSLIAA